MKAVLFDQHGSPPDVLYLADLWRIWPGSIPTSQLRHPDERCDHQALRLPLLLHSSAPGRRGSYMKSQKYSGSRT
jgi:hypothetical protein